MGHSHLEIVQPCQLWEQVEEEEVSDFGSLGYCILDGFGYSSST